VLDVIRLQAFLEARYSSCSKGKLFGENDDVLQAYLLSHSQEFEIVYDKVVLEDCGWTPKFTFRRGVAQRASVAHADHLLIIGIHAP